MDRHGVLVRLGSSQGLMLHCSGIDRLEWSVSCPASCAPLALMAALGHEGDCFRFITPTRSLGVDNADCMTGAVRKARPW